MIGMAAGLAVLILLGAVLASSAFITWAAEHTVKAVRHWHKRRRAA